ncbi:MAG: 50S ribosomal protein L24 [Solobacterium sp.]|jgi:large subunit ribosomal protein L24|nr:50S ribosomal protein L24 [Solobacterium sp.]MCH4205865.1 50S ribosomal protein L24 [Solobacterium sp.]MCH4227350.1 50S ribosomal protein L24 [Solobacterium sp.]MCH4282653.1 50S ribosomal protein L24 [Solobacterium sp.]
MKIKTGDTVKVISGHYKGTVSEVKSVDPKNNKVIVEGVNMIKKSLKPNQQNPEGGVIEKEAEIDASNVMLYDKKAKSISRVGYKVEDGKKTRIFKKSGAEIKEAKK